MESAVRGDGQASVLIVDDEQSLTTVLAKVLGADGHKCRVASNGKDALALIEDTDFDVVVTDITMPEMTGIELLKLVKKRDREIQVIVITGHPDVDFAVEAIRSQVDDYLIKPFEMGQLRHAVYRALEHRALLSENRAYREHLEERVQKQAGQINQLFLDGLQALAAAIEARDRYTGGHLDRVSKYALATGTELGLDERAMWSLWLGSLFHDVGKLAIPDAILNKPGPLTEEEYEEMKRHPELGVEIIQRISFLLPAALAILHHQERWDGNGYPGGLKGERISIEGRILAVADAFDAMLTDRPYRKALTEGYALSELERCAGSQFDPGVVRAFMQAMDKGFPSRAPLSLGLGVPIAVPELALVAHAEVDPREAAE
ncbi:MAG: response regulator [Gemmatimonadota bacterium]|nr:MAG: response regulator [Gemmatimonadota bacterium]